jgi:hypothetical protein
MPLFRLHAEADNLTHVQIEHGPVVIPGPYLVRVVATTIPVSKETGNEVPYRQRKRDSQFSAVHQHRWWDEDVVEELDTD